MFTLSTIKNKKAFFLQIILLSTFSHQLYGNPLYNGYTKINSTAKEHPMITGVAMAIVTTVLTHQINAYLEDPENASLTKQERQKNLELKNHPDYISTVLKEKQVNIEKKQLTILYKRNVIEGERQALVLQELQHRKHVEDEIEKYRTCAREGTTQEERDDCKKIHDSYYEKLNSYFPAK